MGSQEEVVLSLGMADHVPFLRSSVRLTGSISSLVLSQMPAGGVVLCLHSPLLQH